MSERALYRNCVLFHNKADEKGKKRGRGGGGRGEETVMSDEADGKTRGKTEDEQNPVFQNHRRRRRRLRFLLWSLWNKGRGQVAAPSSSSSSLPQTWRICSPSRKRKSVPTRDTCGERAAPTLSLSRINGTRAPIGAGIWKAPRINRRKGNTGHIHRRASVWVREDTTCRILNCFPTLSGGPLT